jgi:hypothetical protein
MTFNTFPWCPLLPMDAVTPSPMQATQQTPQFGLSSTVHGSSHAACNEHAVSSEELSASMFLT